MSVDGLTIKSLCLTQWSVLTRAMEAIYSNMKFIFNLLIEVQNSRRDEYAMKAG